MEEWLDALLYYQQVVHIYSAISVYTLQFELVMKTRSILLSFLDLALV